MKWFFRKLREFFERFYPAEVFTISFTFFRIFLITIIICALAAFFYLRSQNKNGLELLKAKHKEIQLIIEKYFDETTSAKLNPDKVEILYKSVDEYKKNLKMIEKDIEHIERFWFLE